MTDVDRVQCARCGNYLLCKCFAATAGGHCLPHDQSPMPAIDRDEVLRRMTVGVDQALADLRTLSARQLEVMVLLAKGLTSREIGRILRIHQKTAEGHRARLMRNLGVERATEVAVLAAKAGLV